MTSKRAVRLAYAPDGGTDLVSWMPKSEDHAANEISRGGFRGRRR